MDRETNKEKMTRYGIKLFFIFITSIILYIITSIAEGNFIAAEWGNVGSTVYYIVGSVLLVVIITDRK